MGILRVLLLLISAAFLAGCAAKSSLLQTQNNVSTTIAQPRPLTAKVKSQAQKSKPPAPKPDLASTTSHINDLSLPALASPTSRVNNTSPTLGGSTGTRPILGSPEWQNEQAEDARKEQNIKRVIEGICRGC
jgi:hypothetical protein